MIWEIDETAQVTEGIDGSGRPVPSYAASLGLRPAPFGRRAAATAMRSACLANLAGSVAVVAARKALRREAFASAAAVRRSKRSLFLAFFKSLSC